MFLFRVITTIIMPGTANLRFEEDEHYCICNLVQHLLDIKSRISPANHREKVDFQSSHHPLFVVNGT